MLRKSRQSQIDASPGPSAEGYEHLASESIAMLAWLKANQVEFVLVGPVAEAIRGGAGAAGPVAIVLAPYGRNFERLARALASVRASLRSEPGAGEAAQAAPSKITAGMLASGRRWTFACGGHHLEVEARSSDTPGYQELLYEAAKFEPAAGLTVEVASPEDIEHYAHLRRTGSSPEMRISRGSTHELEHRPG